MATTFKFMALASAALLACAGAAGAATIVNGDFETVDGRSGIENGNALNALGGTGKSSWDVYTSLPGGWTNPDRTRFGPGIEVQTNGTLGQIDAHSGSHYVELDSDGCGSDCKTNSLMFQDMILDKGSYELSFWYSPREKDKRTNGIRFSVEDRTPPRPNESLLMSSVTGPNATTTVGIWTQITKRFRVGADGSDIRLGFRAFQKDDERGGLIDTVSVAAVPLPAAGLLLLGGLGGLGLMGRRKASKAKA